MNERNFLIRAGRRAGLVALLFTASLLRAQSALDWFTVDGGGGTSSGGAYAGQGTIGQPDAGVSSGGGYVLHGGFWGAFGGAAAESGPTLRIQLAGMNVTVAWVNPSTGFQLQESTSLTTPDWADVNAVPAVVGGERQVSRPAASAARFYRLRKL